VDFNQLVGIDFTFMQQADLNAKVVSQMTNVFIWIVFDIGGSQEDENFVMNHVKLVTEIINRLNQTCAMTASQYQGVICCGGSLLVENVSQIAPLQRENIN